MYQEHFRLLIETQITICYVINFHLSHYGRQQPLTKIDQKEGDDACQKTKKRAKSQFLRLCKVCSDSSDYIKNSNEYLNFFIEIGYDSSKLKMLAKDMLAKTSDELLPQIKKTQNEQTIMVTIWHPALKHLSKILNKKNIINILKRTSTLKKYSQRNQ